MEHMDVIQEPIGKGQMGSALMGPLQISCFSTEGLFGYSVRAVRIAQLFDAPSGHVHRRTLKQITTNNVNSNNANTHTINNTILTHTNNNI